MAESYTTESLTLSLHFDGNFPGGTSIKTLLAKAGDIRDAGSIPGQKDSRDGGIATHSSIPMDRGAWWAAARKVAESDTTEEA